MDRCIADSYAKREYRRDIVGCRSMAEKNS
jgi:hypothetical protein